MANKHTEFYLRDTRSDIGSTCTFWAKDGCGYTSDLDKAHVFSFDEAQIYADEKRHFIPLSKVVVDQFTTARVDMQLLKLDVDFSEGFVIHRWCGQYDGNDIYFANGLGKNTANYNEAWIYYDLAVLPELVDQSGAILSKKFLDSVCRRTLQSENVNHRKMMTAAGIRYRSPRKKGFSMGKTRGNCPECGKITWDYNPYENAYCYEHELAYTL